MLQKQTNKKKNPTKKQQNKTKKTLKYIFYCQTRRNYQTLRRLPLFFSPIRAYSVIYFLHFNSLNKLKLKLRSKHIKSIYARNETFILITTIQFDFKQTLPLRTFRSLVSRLKVVRLKPPSRIKNKMLQFSRRNLIIKSYNFLVSINP